MYICGITGGISTGKSTVSKYLKDIGFTVVDCDLLARDALCDRKILLEIASIDHKIIKNNEVDRKYLGHLLFTNKQIKIKIESIIHPFVLSGINKVTQTSNDDIIFLDIPLLYEVDWVGLCNEVIVVYTNREIQLERLMKRDNIDIELANLKINNQMDIELKKSKADFIIDNNGSIEKTIKQIEKKVRGLNVVKKK